MTEPVKSRRQRAVRIVLWIGAIAIALVLVGLAALRLYLSPERVRSMASSAVNEAIAGKIELGHVEWSPPASAHIERVAISSPAGGRVISASDVSGSIDPIALFFGRVRIVSAVASKVDVQIELGPSGRYTIVEALSPRKTGGAPAPPIEIESAEIRAIDLDLTEPGIALSARGATISAGRFSMIDGRIESSGEVAIREGSVRAGALPDLAVRDLVGQGVELTMTTTPARGRVSFRRVKASIPFGNVDFSGSIEDLFVGPRYDLRGEVQAALDHPWVRSVLPEEVEAHGTLDAKVTLAGPVAKPELSGSAKATELSVLGTRISRLEVEGKIGGEPRLDRLDAELEDGARLEVKGSTDAIRAELERLPVRRLLGSRLDPELLPETASGTIDLAIRTLVPLDLSADAALSFRGLPKVIGGPEPLDLELSASLSGKKVALARGRARQGELSVDASGSLVLDRSGAIDLTVEASHDRPREILARFAPSLSAQKIALKGAVRGPIGEPRFEGRVRARGLRYDRSPSVDLDAPLVLSRSSIAFRDAVATSTAGTARATGGLGLAPLRFVDLSLTSSASIGALTASVATGFARIEVHANGPIDSPEGTATIEVSRSFVRGIELGAFHASASSDGSVITLAPASIPIAAGGRLRIAGTIAPKEKTGRAVISAERVPISTLDPLESGTGLAGHFSLTASAAGSLADPRIALNMVSEDLIFDGASIGVVGAVMAGDRDRLDGTIMLQGEAGRLEIAGGVEIDARRISAQISARQLDLARLPFIDRAPISVAGQADLDLGVRGSLPYPEISGTMKLSGTKIGPRSIEAPLAIEIAPTSKRGAYQFDLAVGSRLDARGVIDLVAEPFLDAFAELRGITLGELEPRLRDQGVDGEANGTVALTYRRKDRTFTAEASLAKMAVHAAGQTLELDRPAEFRFERGTLTLAPISFSGPLGRIQLRGSYGAESIFSASGEIDLAFVAPLVPGLAQGEGRLRFRAEATGEVDAPRLVGELALVDRVRLRPRTGVREVILTSGVLRLGGDRFEVESLEGQLAGGSFRLGGHVDLEGFTPSELDLRLDALGLPFRSGDVTIEANAGLHLHGSSSSPRIEGSLEITRGRYQKRFKLQNFIFVAEDRTRHEPLERELPWLRDLELDVHLTSAGPVDLKVDASAISLDLSLEADVRIMGTAAEPLLEGRVSADRGRLAFPRAKLEIVRCSVELGSGPDGPERTIDLGAEGEVSTPDPDDPSRRATRQVFLSLEGPLEEARLDLTSEPELDRLQILALLVTGYANVAQIATGAGEDAATVDAALAFAGSQLTGPVSSFVEDQLERALNLELRLGAEVTAGGFRVRASKEITRRLTIEGAYEQSLDESSQITTSARALLQLFNQTFLEASTERTTGGVADPERPSTTSRIELKYRILGQ
jgi:autotransporter translocation and assembly factor TamB